MGDRFSRPLRSVKQFARSVSEKRPGSQQASSEQSELLPLISLQQCHQWVNDLHQPEVRDAYDCAMDHTTSFVKARLGVSEEIHLFAPEGGDVETMDRYFTRCLEDIEKGLVEEDLEKIMLELAVVAWTFHMTTYQLDEHVSFAFSPTNLRLSDSYLNAYKLLEYVIKKEGVNQLSPYSQRVANWLCSGSSFGENLSNEDNSLLKSLQSESDLYLLNEHFVQWRDDTSLMKEVQAHEIVLRSQDLECVSDAFESRDAVNGYSTFTFNSIKKKQLFSTFEHRCKNPNLIERPSFQERFDYARTCLQQGNLKKAQECIENISRDYSGCVFSGDAVTVALHPHHWNVNCSAETSIVLQCGEPDDIFTVTYGTEANLIFESNRTGEKVIDQDEQIRLLCAGYANFYNQCLAVSSRSQDLEPLNLDLSNFIPGVYLSSIDPDKRKLAISEEKYQKYRVFFRDFENTQIGLPAVRALYHSCCHKETNPDLLDSNKKAFQTLHQDVRTVDFFQEDNFNCLDAVFGKLTGSIVNADYDECCSRATVLSNLDDHNVEDTSSKVLCMALFLKFTELGYSGDRIFQSIFDVEVQKKVLMILCEELGTEYVIENIGVDTLMAIVDLEAVVTEAGVLNEPSEAAAFHRWVKTLPSSMSVSLQQRFLSELSNKWSDEDSNADDKAKYLKFSRFVMGDEGISFKLSKSQKLHNRSKNISVRFSRRAASSEASLDEQVPVALKAFIGDVLKKTTPDVNVYIQQLLECYHLDDSAKKELMKELGLCLMFNSEEDKRALSRAYDAHLARINDLEFKDKWKDVCVEHRTDYAIALPFEARQCLGAATGTSIVCDNGQVVRLAYAVLASIPEIVTHVGGYDALYSLLFSEGLEGRLDANLRSRVNETMEDHVRKILEQLFQEAQLDLDEFFKRTSFLSQNVFNFADTVCDKMTRMNTVLSSYDIVKPSYMDQLFTLSNLSDLRCRQSFKYEGKIVEDDTTEPVLQGVRSFSLNCQLDSSEAISFESQLFHLEDEGAVSLEEMALDPTIDQRAGGGPQSLEVEASGNFKDANTLARWRDKSNTSLVCLENGPFTVEQRTGGAFIDSERQRCCRSGQAGPFVDSDRIVFDPSKRQETTVSATLLSLSSPGVHAACNESQARTSEDFVSDALSSQVDDEGSVLFEGRKRDIELAFALLEESGILQDGINGFLQTLFLLYVRQQGDVREGAGNMPDFSAVHDVDSFMTLFASYNHNSYIQSCIYNALMSMSRGLTLVEEAVKEAEEGDFSYSQDVLVLRRGFLDHNDTDKGRRNEALACEIECAFWHEIQGKRLFEKTIHCAYLNQDLRGDSTTGKKEGITALVNFLKQKGSRQATLEPYFFTIDKCCGFLENEYPTKTYFDYAEELYFCLEHVCEQLEIPFLAVNHCFSGKDRSGFVSGITVVRKHALASIHDFVRSCLESSELSDNDERLLTQISKTFSLTKIETCIQSLESETFKSFLQGYFDQMMKDQDTVTRFIGRQHCPNVMGQAPIESGLLRFGQFKLAECRKFVTAVFNGGKEMRAAIFLAHAYSGKGRAGLVEVQAEELSWNSVGVKSVLESVIGDGSSEFSRKLHEFYTKNNDDIFASQESFIRFMDDFMTYCIEETPNVRDLDAYDVSMGVLFTSLGDSVLLSRSCFLWRLKKDVRGIQFAFEGTEGFDVVSQCLDDFMCIPLEAINDQLLTLIQGTLNRNLERLSGDHPMRLSITRFVDSLKDRRIDDAYQWPQRRVELYKGCSSQEVLLGLDYDQEASCYYFQDPTSSQSFRVSFDNVSGFGGARAKYHAFLVDDQGHKLSRLPVFCKDAEESEALKGESVLQDINRFSCEYFRSPPQSIMTKVGGKEEGYSILVMEEIETTDPPTEVKLVASAQHKGEYVYNRGKVKKSAEKILLDQEGKHGYKIMDGSGRMKKLGAYQNRHFLQIELNKVLDHALRLEGILPGSENYVKRKAEFYRQYVLSFREAKQTLEQGDFVLMGVSLIPVFKKDDTTGKVTLGVAPIDIDHVCMTIDKKAMKVSHLDDLTRDIYAGLTQDEERKFFARYLEFIHELRTFKNQNSELFTDLSENISESLEKGELSLEVCQALQGVNIGEDLRKKFEFLHKFVEQSVFTFVHLKKGSLDGLERLCHDLDAMAPEGVFPYKGIEDQIQLMVDQFKDAREDPTFDELMAIIELLKQEEPALFFSNGSCCYDRQLLEEFFRVCDKVCTSEQFITFHTDLLKVNQSSSYQRGVKGLFSSFQMNERVQEDLALGAPMADRGVLLPPPPRVSSSLSVDLSAAEDDGT
ncbi:MAG: hypothetical protein VW378_07745 [bacterium]